MPKSLKKFKVYISSDKIPFIDWMNYVIFSGDLENLEI